MTGPIDITQSLLSTMPLPELSEESDKEERGRVLVIAGGHSVPGVAVLVGLAALRVGAGKLQVAATPEARIALGIAMPEARILHAEATMDGEIAPSSIAMLEDKLAASDAVIAGPGMVDDDAAGELGAALLKSGAKQVVLDAAALVCLRESGKRKSETLILTPHAGELASLTGDSVESIRADKPRHAARAARSYDAIVVLKGAETVIATPDGRIFRHAGGVPGLGTSDSGDVLAGAIGGLLARGLEAHQAAVWGVFLHARAGKMLTQEIGALGFLARDLLPKLPLVLSQFDARAPAHRSGVE